MALVGSWNYTLSNNTTADADQVMSDLNQLKTGVNSINSTQLETTGGVNTSKIPIKDQANTFSAAQTFSAAVTFASTVSFVAASIADAALSTNIPKKDAANTFSGVNTFSQPITGLQLPTLAAHPSAAGDDGKIYLYQGDGKAYRYKHGTGGVQIDYTGGYTGGSLRCYSGAQVVDDGSPLIIMFKTNSSISSAVLKLVSLPFPSYPYTELPYHRHAVGSLLLSSGSVTGLDHTHDVVIGSHTHSGTNFASTSHTHAVSGTTATGATLAHSHTFSDTVTSGAGSSHVHGLSSGGTTVGNNSANHTHSVSGDTALTAVDDGGGIPSSHHHDISLTSGSNSANHNHTVALTGNSAAEAAHTHSVTVSGTTSISLSTHSHTYSATTDGPSATASVASYNIGTKTSSNLTWSGSPAVGTAITGNTAYSGISGPTVSSSIKSRIDDLVEVRIASTVAGLAGAAAKTKGDSGWTSLGDLDDPAKYETAEIDISALLASSSWNYIKVSEPTAGLGGIVMWAVETT